jgi:hypothetical protein
VKLVREEIDTLQDEVLIAIARNVKKYEANEDLSDLVLELADRLERRAAKRVPPCVGHANLLLEDGYE